MATPFELSGPYKRTQAGNVDFYYGGGEEAWDSLADAYSGIPAGMRQGLTFGVWTADGGDTVLKEYCWNIQGETGDGEENPVNEGGSAAIDDSTASLETTWSSKKIGTDFVVKVSGKGLSTNDYSNTDKAKVDGLSILFLGDYVSLAELQATHATATAGQFAHVGADKYTWSATSGSWELSPDGVLPTFTADFTVVLSGGKTFGKYSNGQTVPANGKTAPDVILDAYRERTPPTYNAPTANITLSEDPNVIEIGTTIPTLTIDSSFTQNDAGSTTGLSIEQDGTEISTTEPVNQNNVLVTETPVSYAVEYSYGDGVVKNDSLGDPDATGQILAGTVSDSIELRGYKKIFYGSTNTQVTTSAEARALPQSRFTTQGVTGFNLMTQIGFKYLYIACPVEYSVPQPTGGVIDLDTANGTDISNDYVLIDDTFEIFHPDGTSSTYNLYEYITISGYATNKRHRVNLV